MQSWHRMMWLLSTVLAVVLICPAIGQAAYPEKNIRIIVPFKAGGGSDVSARLFAKYWEKHLPVKVVVTNIDGGGGRIGEMEVQQARADGYTLLWQHHQMYAQNICGFSKYTWEVFTPVVTAVTSPFALIARKSLDVSSVTELLDRAQKAPGSLTWAFSPMANTQFYFLDLMNAMNLPPSTFRGLTNLPGDANRLIAMLRGDVDVTVNTLANVMPYYKSGDIKLFALTGESSIPGFDAIKTLKDLNIPSTLGQTDYIVWGPKGMPAEACKILADAAAKALEEPELINEATKLGIVANYYAGEALIKKIRSDFARMESLAKQYGIQKK